MALVACGDAPAAVPGAEPERRAEEKPPATASAAAPAAESPAGASPAPAPACADPLPVYEAGAVAREVCPEDLRSDELTLVDLADDYVPLLFTEDAEGDAGPQPYAPLYRALADERLEDVPSDFDAERFLELFGIFPTFRVLLGRLEDAERHACHRALESAPLRASIGTLPPWEPVEPQQERVRRVRYLKSYLERAAARLGVTELAALDADPEEGVHYRRYLRFGEVVRAVETTQAHLACDGLLFGRTTRGVFDRATASALERWQRMHMVVSNGSLDAETRLLLLEDSREQDYQALLRALRERVADAAGLIEDGSAGHRWRDVFGRPLDAPEFRFDAGQPPAPMAAPDLIAPATEAAARALGWTDPDAATEALRRLRRAGHTRVALALGPRPAYHGPAMPLRVEVDRGDVVYDYPYASDGRRLPFAIERRPVVTLYAGDRALVRWPTTIGGWKPEVSRAGQVGLRYKESFAGPRVMRDLIASPAWLPPPSARADELAHRTPTGWKPRYDLFGPGYRSAYGLVMAMHHRELPAGDDGVPRLFDEGIRIHGSVSYRSITTGTSHGCHRLTNHLAVRLAGFLLRHRPHVRHGSMRVRYRRRVVTRGGPLTFEIRSRGYRYELTPPIPVTVLEGTLKGRARRPITGFRPLRESLVREVQASAAADG
ncbi:MAG: L,D-transpeptidase [Myxococcota bacterium]